ncbi:chymotrypsinogen B-like protein, partial [Dinothrombium tinctorium]
ASLVGQNCQTFAREYFIGGSIASLGLSGFASDGDSGSSLILQRNGRYTLVGVYSTICMNNETQNCDPSCPIIFTRVENHLHWIHSIINGNTYNISDYYLGAFGILASYLKTNYHKHDELKFAFVFES